MLYHLQRVAGYLAQTGRTTLTPRQRRRVRHKDAHQSAAATEKRAARAARRAETARARAARRLGLPR